MEGWQVQIDQSKYRRHRALGAPWRSHLRLTACHGQIGRDPSECAAFDDNRVLIARGEELVGGFLRASTRAAKDVDRLFPRQFAILDLAFRGKLIQRDIANVRHMDFAEFQWRPDVDDG